MAKKKTVGKKSVKKQPSKKKEKISKVKKKSKPPIKNGPPVKFKKEYYELFRHFGNHGYTNKEIAKRIKINEDTLYAWYNKYDGLAEAVKEGKLEWDEQVEAALHRSAIGATVKEIKVTNHLGQIIETLVKKELPPNPISMKFWLMNRNRAKWNEKQDVNLNHKGSVNVNLIRPNGGQVEEIEEDE